MSKNLSNQFIAENVQNRVVSTFQGKKTLTFYIEIDTSGELAEIFLCAYLISTSSYKDEILCVHGHATYAAKILQSCQSWLPWTSIKLECWKCTSQYKYWDLGISERDEKLSPLWEFHAENLSTRFCSVCTPETVYFFFFSEVVTVSCLTSSELPQTRGEE